MSKTDLKCVGTGLIVGVMLFGLTSCAAQISAAQGSSGCRSPVDSRSQHRIDYLKNLVSSTDTAQVAWRQRLGIPSASPNKITLVTKQSTSQSVVTGLNTIIQTPGVVRQVYVFTTGNGGYAVDDPSLDREGRDRDLYFLTKNFTYQAVVNGF